MTPDPTILPAALDRELLPEEQIRILQAAAADPERAEQAWEIYQLKTLLQAAYADLPPPPTRHPVPPPRRRVQHWQAWAASVLLLIFGAGPQTLAPDTAPVAPEALAQDFAQLRLVIHVNSAQADKIGSFLDELEMLLADPPNNLAQVELLFNGPGLRWLRPEHSLYQARLQALQSRHPEQLRLVACNNSLERLRLAEHRSVKLLPGSILTPSGVVHASLRQQEGWAYIQV